jgi:membrane protein YdbS with pleckstrin-like domain
MVGPSQDAAERAAFRRKIRVAVALLVGVSMALMGLSTGGSWQVIAGAFLAGTLIGAVLSYWLVPDSLTTQQFR